MAIMVTIFVIKYDDRLNFAPYVCDLERATVRVHPFYPRSTNGSSRFSSVLEGAFQIRQILAYRIPEARASDAKMEEKVSHAGARARSDRSSYPPSKVLSLRCWRFSCFPRAM